jgi:hypothetical protein
MTRFARTLAAWSIAGAGALAQPAFATAPVETCEYKIKHALYGDIGTYTNTIARNGERTEVVSTLRVAVKILGLVVYRREADRFERWQGDRLVTFTSAENRNGQLVEVRGEARGDAFVISSPAGQVIAPAYVRPSNPWSADILRASVMMSTSTGTVLPAMVRGGQEDMIALEGRIEKLRRFEIDSDKREYVWLDRNDIPVAFRTHDEGTTIDFVLSRYPSGEAGLWPASLPDVAQAGPAPRQYAEGER